MGHLHPHRRPICLQVWQASRPSRSSLVSMGSRTPRWQRISNQYVKRWTVREKRTISNDTLQIFVCRLFGATVSGHVMGVTLESPIILLYANVLAMGPTSMPVECLISSSNKVKSANRARFLRESINNILVTVCNLGKLSEEVDFRHIVGFWRPMKQRRFNNNGTSDKFKNRPEKRSI